MRNAVCLACHKLNFRSQGEHTKRGPASTFQGSGARSSRLQSTENLVRVRVSFPVGVPAEQRASVLSDMESEAEDVAEDQLESCC